MTDSIKAAELIPEIDLKDGTKFLAPIYVEEQMLLPTLELYLSTAVSLPPATKKRTPRRPKPAATVCVWERLF